VVTGPGPGTPHPAVGAGAGTERVKRVPGPRGEADPGLLPVPAGGWRVAWPSPGAGRSFTQSWRLAPSASSGPRTSASSSSGSSRLWWVPGRGAVTGRRGQAGHCGHVQAGSKSLQPRSCCAAP